jgi:hypothetical protein
LLQVLDFLVSKAQKEKAGAALLLRLTAVRKNKLKYDAISPLLVDFFFNLTL